MHLVHRADGVPAGLDIYVDRAGGLTRRPLVDAAAGSVHQAVVHTRLAPGGRVDRHLHAFEETWYLLSGSLEVEVGDGLEKLADDDYLWIEVGVPHAIVNPGSTASIWVEVSAPMPGAALEDTVFTKAPGAEVDLSRFRGHFDVAELPEPSGVLGLAGFGGGNVGGASLKMLVDRGRGSSQLNLMALRSVPGGAIKEHDHAFEEAFYFVEGDFYWSGCGSMHSFTNRSEAPVRWIETQVPQPPSRHQARFVGEWEQLTELGKRP
jgi:quercetin dioxygenase-like cupin family protein